MTTGSAKYICPNLCISLVSKYASSAHVEHLRTIASMIAGIPNKHTSDSMLDHFCSCCSFGLKCTSLAPCSKMVGKRWDCATPVLNSWFGDGWGYTTNLGFMETTTFVAIFLINNNAPVWSH